jgi:hypothetical protein
MIGLGHGVSEFGARNSYIRRINLQRSSDGFAAVSGAVFKGFSVDYFDFTNGGSGSFTFDNIVLDNLSIYTVNQPGGPRINNLTIKNSVIGGIYLTLASGNENTKIYQNRLGVDIYQRPINIFYATNPLITNNLIYWHSVSFNIQNSSNVRIEHNVISGSGQTFEYLQNALVVNNIFFGMTAGCINTTYTFKDNVFSNNLVTTAGFVMPPAANGGGTNSGANNLASGSNPQFTSASVVTVLGAASLFNYTLQAGSVCIGAATTGENIGPSGGLYPWTSNLSLKPSNIPVITEFGNSGVVPQNQPLKSNIKAKSN